MREKKKNRKMLLLILLLAISVGFAALATTLKINGSTNITKQTWDIYWDNASIVPTTNLANADITKGAQTKSGDNTTLEWTVNLNLPGDYYEFTVDAVNNGTIDAMITEIDSKIGTDSIISTNNGQLVVDESVIPNYLKYSVTYFDGTELGLNHLLAKKTNNTPTREKYKVRVEYNKDLDNDDLDEVTSPTEELTFTFSVKYEQADNTAVPSHAAAEWTLPQGKTKDTLTVGDEICLDTECFNFVKYDGNDVVMLSKYNLKVGNIYDSSWNKTGEYTSSDLGYNKQSSEASGIMYEDVAAYSGAVAFSTTNYWYDGSTDGIKAEYGNDWDDNNVYDIENYPLAPEIGEYGYPINDDYSIAYYVEEYKDILEEAGATIKEARLLTYAEATDSSIGCDSSCPTTGDSSFITNTTFWLGSAGSYDAIWTVFYPYGNFQYNYHRYVDSAGVRPVIVVAKSNL